PPPSTLPATPEITITPRPRAVSLLSMFAVPLRGVSRGEQASRHIEVDVPHQHALLAVGEKRQTLALRAEQAGRRLLIAEGVVDAGEIDRVLQGTTHHRLLEIGPAWRRPVRRLRPRLVAPRAVGMKDDLRAPRCRPSHRLGVTEALMADGH